MKNDKGIPEKGLIIGPKWANLIVSGSKSWELRKRATKIRGDIGIIAQGTGTIIGTANIVDCIGPLDQKALMDGRELACETEAEVIKDIEDGYVYAWVLKDPVKFDRPVPYKHPSGAQSWVNLDDRALGKTSPQINAQDATPDDFGRVGGKLSDQTRGKGAPEYNPISTLFQAAVKGEVIGEAIVTKNWGKLEIDLMFVEAGHRGKGVGKSLIRAIEDFARAQGVHAIRLNSPTWQGVGFYERVGYKEMGRIPLDPDRDDNPQAEVTYSKVLKGP